MRVLLAVIVALVLSSCGAMMSSHFEKRELTNQEITNLKKTKTLFWVNDTFTVSPTLEKLIQKSWTYTPYEIVRSEELPDYASQSDYSLFYYEKFRVNYGDAKFKNIRYHTFLRLTTLENYKNDGYLYGSFETYIRPNIIALNLIDMQINLNNKKKLNPYEFIHNKPEIKKLLKETLYVVKEDIEIHGMSLFNSDVEYHDPKELFSEYPGKYKVISKKKLTDKILNGDDFYLFTSIRSGNKQLLMVYNSKRGKVYNTLARTGYNFFEDDIANIVDGEKPSSCCCIF